MKGKIYPPFNPRSDKYYYIAPNGAFFILEKDSFKKMPVHYEYSFKYRQPVPFDTLPDTYKKHIQTITVAIVLNQEFA